MLALRMATPCRPLFPDGLSVGGHFLVSVKLRDCTVAERSHLGRSLAVVRDGATAVDVFFHTFDGLAEELALARTSRTVYAANDEIAAALQLLGLNCRVLWCPALVRTGPDPADGTLNVFSFGMAHKIQKARYAELHRLLHRVGCDYRLRVSTAFHEKARFGDFDSVSAKLQTIFGRRMSFLGFLSDAAVNYFLDRSHLFVAFFEQGVRANNTSVHAAMHRGCAVLTNMDAHSPPWFRHGHNVLDIECVTAADLAPMALRRVGLRGQRVNRAHASWGALVRVLSHPSARRR